MSTDTYNFMQEIFSTVLTHSVDLFAYIDSNYQHQYVSDSYASFYNIKSNELMGKTPQQLISAETYQNIVLPNLLKCFNSAKPVNFQTWISPKHQNDNSYLYVTFLPHFSKELQKVVGIIVIAKDVTDFKRAEHLLSQSANTDALTNIPNRLFLNKKLDKLCQNANRQSDHFALLFCDLDGFKAVNDQFGHAVGDKILGQVAKRLSQHIRSTDIIARYGGDEFVILITDRVDDKNLSAVRNKIFNSISQPFNFSGQRIRVGISIGIALYPNDGQTPDALLEKADEAMYSSKNSAKAM